MGICRYFDRMGTMVRARIRFRTTEEGGRKHPPVSGVRSQLQLGTVQTSCIVRKLTDEGSELLELGKEYEVSIEILFWEDYRCPLAAGSEIDLCEGSRVVASGQLLEHLS